MKQTSIKINPLPDDSEKSPLQKDVGQLSVDIYYTEKEIVILAPIAGVEKEDIKVSLTEDVLVIKGDRKQIEKVSEENYYIKECFWGPFSRAIVLPLESDLSKISASFENNILEIRIPKTDKQEKTKIIKIKA